MLTVLKFACLVGIATQQRAVLIDVTLGNLTVTGIADQVNFGIDVHVTREPESEVAIELRTRPTDPPLPREFMPLVGVAVSDVEFAIGFRLPYSFF